MRSDQADFYFSVAAGTLGAIVLGAMLIPLREWTAASNLAFLFLALTIVVAEVGGGMAAVATALSSALSLDFFLTRPYLRLAIADKHDVIAFVGLAACGLIAAAAGSRRRVRRAALAAARRHVELLRDGLRRVEHAGPLQPALDSLLAAAVAGLPISGAVVRDEHARALSSVGRVREMRPPEPPLDLESPQELPLPAEGGRIALRDAERTVGWLDVWGNRQPAGLEDRHTLVAVGRIAAALLARARTRAEPS